MTGKVLDRFGGEQNGIKFAQCWQQTLGINGVPGGFAGNEGEVDEELGHGWFRSTIDGFLGKTGRENQLVVEPGFDFAQPSTPDFAGLTLKHGDRLIMADSGEMVQEFAQGVACG
jgi:hypothetical protein